MNLLKTINGKLIFLIPILYKLEVGEETSLKNKKFFGEISMKIVTIIGARPQFVKAAVVSRVIAKYNYEYKEQVIDEVIVHTGQHYDANMSDIFFKEMQMPNPNYHLGIGGASHAIMTGRMLEKIEEVLLKEKPDIVMVYGDTNSTLAGALAAAKLHIPVAHVEAGLRSFNMQMPEEVNRILTDRVSNWLLCPTETAVLNLEGEGVSNWANAKVYNVGDVMYDAALFYKEKADPTEEVKNLVSIYKDDFYLATIHRAENTDDKVRLANIFKALDEVSSKVPVILPLHPRTKKLLSENDIQLANIICINPVGYFDMITLLAECKGVFTDSGGVQKEAYFFGKPCITLREETEWMELIDHGFNKLAGASYEIILELEESFMRTDISDEVKLYGDGRAGEKIVGIISSIHRH